MKVFWKDGALNLKPETEEDGRVTSSILFAYGTSNLGQVVLEIGADRIADGADQQSIVGVNMLLDASIQSIPGVGASDKPLGEQDSMTSK
jgi:hypothetical protein